jgi:hypothetical protein
MAAQAAPQLNGLDLRLKIPAAGTTIHSPSSVLISAAVATAAFTIPEEGGFACVP